MFFRSLELSVLIHVWRSTLADYINTLWRTNDLLLRREPTPIGRLLERMEIVLMSGAVTFAVALILFLIRPEPASSQVVVAFWVCVWQTTGRLLFAGLMAFVCAGMICKGSIILLTTLNTGFLLHAWISALNRRLTRDLRIHMALRSTRVLRLFLALAERCVGAKLLPTIYLNGSAATIIAYSAILIFTRELDPFFALGLEIGRASCRERV